MENSLEELNSRLEQAEERLNELEDRTIEIIKFGEQEKKNEEKWIEPKGLVRHHQVGQHMHNESPCREEKGAKILCEEIMAENF